MEVVTEVVEKATEALARLGNLDFVVQTLGNVGDTIRNAASSDDGGILKVTGVSDVVGICPGLESKATTDEANGKLTFTVTFDKSFVDPVIWGEFMDCQFNQSGLGITLNSTMDLHLGAPMALDSLRFDEILFRLDGSYLFEGTSYPLGLDFRLQEDAIEFRIPAEGGDVIAKLGRDLSEVAIRTSDGSFCCHFENRYCDEVTGDSCEDPADGTRLSW
jgi:hypothetical protein